METESSEKQYGDSDKKGEMRNDKYGNAGAQGPPLVCGGCWRTQREGEPLVCCFLLCGPFALSYGTSLQLNALWPIANKWTCPVGLVQSLAP